MLFRLLPKPSNLRSLTLISSKLGSHLEPQFPSTPQNPSFTFTPRFFSSSSNHNGNGKDQSEGSAWNFSRENDGKLDPLFGGENVETGPGGGADSWLKGRDGGDEWETAEGYKPWTLVEEEKNDLFDIGEAVSNVGEAETEVRGLEWETQNVRAD